MLRTPSLKMTGRRHATHATDNRQIASSATSTVKIPDIGIPNISFTGRFLSQGNYSGRSLFDGCAEPGSSRLKPTSIGETGFQPRPTGRLVTGAETPRIRA